MSTYAEQLTAAENKRAANVAAMDEIMKKAADEQRTLDDAEQEEFDNIQADNEALDNHIKRLRKMDQEQKAAAKPVEKPTNAGEGAQARGGISIQSGAPKLEKGDRKSTRLNSSHVKISY